MQYWFWTRGTKPKPRGCGEGKTTCPAKAGRRRETMRKTANVAATLAVALMVLGALFTSTTALARSQTCMIVAYVCNDGGCMIGNKKSITVEVGENMTYEVALTGNEYLLVEQRCTGGAPTGKLVLKYTAPGGSREFVPIDDGRGVRSVIIRGTPGKKPGEAGPVETHIFDLCGGAKQRATFLVTKIVPASPPREPSIEEKLEAARAAETEAKRKLAEERAALKGLQGAHLKQVEGEAERLEEAARNAEAKAEAERERFKRLAAEMDLSDDGNGSGSDFGGSLTLRGVGFIGTNQGLGGDVRGLWHAINPPESGGWGVATGLRGRFLQTSKEVVNAPGSDVWATSRNYIGEVQVLAIARASKYVIFMFGLTGFGGGADWQEATDGRNPRVEGIFSLNGGGEVHLLFGGGALALTLAIEGGGLWGSPPEINDKDEDKAVGTVSGNVGVAYHF